MSVTTTLQSNKACGSQGEIWRGGEGGEEEGRRGGKVQWGKVIVRQSPEPYGICGPMFPRGKGITVGTMTR